MSELTAASLHACAALIEALDDAVLLADETGTVRAANSRAAALLGRAGEDLTGLELQALLAGHPARVSTGALTLDGVALSLLTLREESGHDDAAERALMIDELRRSNRDLEQFAYVASHDLSEPLRVIAGFVDLLARRYRGQLDEDADRFIDFIISGVERLQTLIDDLLAYSRAGRAELAAQELDTGEVVRDVLWALAPQMRERRAEVDVGELPTLRAERPMLRQIFQNLISNAIKFGDPALPVVHVRASRVTEAWRFDVHDNGAGINPRHAERVFEMFQRLHGRDVPGSGMGLAIVKRLVERHGGRVWVTAGEQEGSIFSFTIPDRARSV